MSSSSSGGGGESVRSCVGTSSASAGVDAPNTEYGAADGAGSRRGGAGGGCGRAATGCGRPPCSTTPQGFHAAAKAGGSTPPPRTAAGRCRIHRCTSTHNPAASTAARNTGQSCGADKAGNRANMVTCRSRAHRRSIASGRRTTGASGTHTRRTERASRSPPGDRCGTPNRPQGTATSPSSRRPSLWTPTGAAALAVRHVRLRAAAHGGAAASRASVRAAAQDPRTPCHSLPGASSHSRAGSITNGGSPTTMGSRSAQGGPSAVARHERFAIERRRRRADGRRRSTLAAWSRPRVTPGHG